MAKSDRGDSDRKEPQHSKLSRAQARSKGTQPEVKSISAKTRGMQQKAQARRRSG